MLCRLLKKVSSPYERVVHAMVTEGSQNTLSMLGYNIYVNYLNNFVDIATLADF